MNLLDLLAADVNRSDTMRGVVAKVTAVTGRTVDLSVQGGALAGIPVADTYPTPTAGDTVFVVKMGAAWLVVASLGKITAPGGPNFLSNPSMEYGSPGSQPSDWNNFWVFGGGTATAFVTANDFAHSGTYSAKGAISGTSTGIRLETNSAYPVAPSTLYKIAYWYRVSSPMPTGASISVTSKTAGSAVGAAYFSTDPTYAQTTVASVQPLVAGSWQYVEASFTTPANALFIRPDVVAQTGATTWTGTVWLDDVTLRTA